MLLYFFPPLQLVSITLPLTPLHPIFPTCPPPLSSPPCMWRSVFGDPQLACWVQVKLNYWGMFPCSMAGLVGLSMGALPLHWQPGDFHFKGGVSSFQTTFPCNSHCLCSVCRHSGAVSQSSRFNDVYVWGTSQDLVSPSLVETLCFCDCRPSSSIKGTLNAFLPLACSTFIFLHEQHVGTLKTVLRSSQ